MPLAVLLAFDEVENSYQFPFMLLLTLILAGGALAYMLSNRTWQRVLALLVSTTWAVAVTVVGNGIYWHGRQEFWMRQPGNGYEVVAGMVTAGGVLTAVMFAPALLGLLRRSVKFVQAG
jgi:hypothetical protein